MTDYMTYPIAFTKQVFIGIAGNPKFGYFDSEPRWAVPVSTTKFLTGIGNPTNNDNNKNVFVFFIGI